MNVQPLTDGRTDGRIDTQKFGGYNIIPRHFLWRGIKRQTVKTISSQTPVPLIRVTKFTFNGTCQL